VAQTLQRTPLFERHVALGARMVPFAGWEMPVQYEGVIPEDRAVRTDCGVFDVSHMGELEVEGMHAFDLLQSLLKDPVLAEPALKGLASTDDPKTPAAILAAYPDLSQPAKRAAINTLSFRPAFAKGLMQAVKDNKIPRKDLTAYTVRQLRSFGDKEIDAWTTEIWGVAKTSNEQKLAEIAKYKSLLTSDVLKTGDAIAGRALFSKTCMQCHTLFGEGGKVGPDLTGSNRQDIDYLMVNIVDPSAVIAKDYMVSNIYMKDGDAYSGIITKEDEHTLSVTVESGVQVLQKEEVKEIRRSELSMMPEGLLTPLSKTELVNLITYLRSTSQVGETQRVQP